MVEFAIVVPLLILLLCGAIDFGLIFGGYQSMQSGLDSATRSLSLNAVPNPGSVCGGAVGSTTAQTAYAVCNVAAALGPLTGMNTNTLKVGICFVTPGSTPSCGGTTPATGTSVTQDVEVCVQVAMQSTTGLTSVFVSGSTVSASSRLLEEQPQPSGATAFESYNANSSAVQYNGRSVPGLTCS
jgi:Flp pilus assembly protein TadG